MTMNTTWGYSEHDGAWKSDETLIRNLIDIVSKGGNYLLNIGPKGDGSVPAESVKSMRAIGRWLSVNGESIYGTSASLFSDLSWGRSTTKGHSIYVHVFRWPEDGTLLVPGLRSAVRSAQLLASEQALQVKRTDKGVVVLLPAAAPDPVASVIELKLEGEPRVAR
jgi:alpha-L-fucosidase